VDVNRYVKKEILYAKVFIAIGIIGIAILLIDLIFDLRIKSLLGVGSALAFGFTPTGVGMFLIYKNATRNPKIIKNIELENEERNIFINTKSAHSAFWIMYWYIFILVMLNNIINISFYKFGIFTLIFMPVVYFSMVVINHKRY